MSSWAPICVALSFFLCDFQISKISLLQKKQKQKKCCKMDGSASTTWRQRSFALLSTTQVFAALCGCSCLPEARLVFLLQPQCLNSLLPEPGAPGPPLMKHTSCLESDNSTTCSFGAFSLLIRIQATFLSSVRVKKGFLQTLYICVASRRNRFMNLFFSSLLSALASTGSWSLPALYLSFIWGVIVLRRLKFDVKT